ncbi:CLUMA_CG003130, isoform B [Clunio marinus]|uniref:CLUMA_CG003130, isoform B n=1 Tax=Clunio marinus TaxID=568069 RepID=A0A1J1HMT8_9DIPT|nr:CLUMA_CG003130, isoform B [Clunio marinus]
MTRISFYFALVLCIFALTIIGSVNAGGDDTNSSPLCGSGSAPCAAITCPDGFAPHSIVSISGNCCCAFSFASAFVIIGFVSAGGGVPSTSPICRLDEVAPCETVQCSRGSVVLNKGSASSVILKNFTCTKVDHFKMRRTSFFFALVLCIYAFIIIGFVSAGGDVPSTFPECGLGQFVPCQTFTCPDGISKFPIGASGNCCCAFN